MTIILTAEDNDLESVLANCYWKDLLATQEDHQLFLDFAKFCRATPQQVANVLTRILDARSRKCSGFIFFTMDTGERNWGENGVAERLAYYSQHEPHEFRKRFLHSLGCETGHSCSNGVWFQWPGYGMKSEWRGQGVAVRMRLFG